VPGRFGTNETPDVPVFTIQPGAVCARLPQPQ
jgi:hypothetical protein